MKPRSFVHVLGIDLGGGKGKKTALATLRVDGEAATVVDIAPRNGALPFYDTALIDTIRQYGDETLLCVDAPLTLPPCLRCTVSLCPGQNACVDPSVLEMRALADEGAKASDRDARRGKPPITPYTQRATEVHLTGRLGIVAREGLGQGTGPLAARAAHLLRRARRPLSPQRERHRGFSQGDAGRARARHAVQEDPARTWGPTPHSGGAGRRAALRPRRPQRELCIQSDHLFEAVICAYTGFLWARDGWVLPPAARPREDAERLRDGWIWTPPPRANAEKSAAEG